MSQESIVENGITWHDLVRPSEEELRALQRLFGFHDLDIDDCLSENERPKIEEYESYLFLVFHIPVPSKASGRLLKEELNVFLGKDFIVTIHEGKADILTDLWKKMKNSPKERGETLGEGSSYFLYELMHALFDAGFPLIESMMKELRRIEVELFEHDESKVVVLRDILTLKRNIIIMRSILFPQRSVIALLQHKNKELIPEEMEPYFDDVHDAIERQWSLLDTAKEMGEALQDTHESWLSHKTNTVIRVLTIFSVTMLPLTFLTGLYGMNVGLPLQDNPAAFWVLLCIMFVILGALLSYFSWKKWL